MNKICTVKEIKKLIDKVMIKEYTYKTNFSCAEFLVDISNKLIVAARLVKHNNKMEYEFVLDTQFLSEKDITVDELKMINEIINILEDNKKFVISKLKKYTVEEYEREEEYRKKQSEMILKALTESIATGRFQ